MPDMDSYDVFIAYGHPDEYFVKKLVSDLQSKGVNCWFFPENYTPGEITWQEIGRKRLQSNKMLVVCSVDSLIRDGLLKEIENQIDEDPNKIIPISLDRTWMHRGFIVKRGDRDLKNDLVNRNYIDFSQKSNYEESLNKLLSALRHSVITSYIPRTSDKFITYYVPMYEYDMELAINVGKHIFEDFYNRKGFFHNYDLMESVLPTNIEKYSMEHSLYLTYVISIDYMVNASKLWNKSRIQYEKNPEFFNPNNIITMKLEKIEDFIKKIGARYPKTASETWRSISKILLEKYNGDPRNITNVPLSIDEVREKINLFPYLRGNKLFNVYIRLMLENKLFKIKNIYDINMNVDVSTIMFTIYTGIIKPLKNDDFKSNIDENFKSIIEDIWNKTGKEINVPSWKLDEPIYAIGSKLCTNKMCFECPIYEYCKKNY